MARNRLGQPSFRSYVLWELSLRGDINENHKDGNAIETLRQRLYTSGAPADQLSKLSTVLSQLQEAGKITRLADGRRTKAIRLVKTAKMPSNPYPVDDDNKFGANADDDDFLPTLVEEPVATVEVENEQSLLNGHREWPAEKKQLAAELMASAYRDIAKAKAML